MNEPWMKFFTGDYFRDPGVRSVSLAARGLWMDMLCLMHQNARKGYLQHPSGLPVTPVQLARMAGGGVDEVAGLLQELENSGVFSRTKDGVIYSRRMDRDARKSALCSEAGRRGGGSPKLKEEDPTFKGQSKGGSKVGSKVISPSESESESESDAEANASTLPAAAGRTGVKAKSDRDEGASPPAPERTADARFKAVMEGYAEAYLAEVGEDYAPNYGRDGLALKKFLPTLKPDKPAEHVVNAALLALRRRKEDRFASACKYASSLHSFCAHYPDIIAELSQTKTNGHTHRNAHTPRPALVPGSDW